MNKIYIKPAVSVITVKPVNILAGSTIEIDKGEEFNSANGDEVLGRRGHNSVWDDEY